MVQGGQIPDVVEMPDRWMALYANNEQLVDLGPYMEGWARRRAADRRAPRSSAAWSTAQTYMIPYGFYLRAMFWNKKLFERGRPRRPARDHGRVHGRPRRRSPSSDGKYGYCLRGGPGGANGYIMMMLNMMGQDNYFDEDGNIDARTSPDAVKGLQFLVDMYQNGYVPQGQRQLGLQRDRRRLLLRHLRDARPGPGRADRDQGAHARGGLRGRADAARARRQVVPDHRLRRLVDVRGLASTRTRLEADRAISRAPRATSNGRSSSA